MINIELERISREVRQTLKAVTTVVIEHKNKVIKC